MKNITMNGKKTLTACLVSLALAACGESDLVALQDSQLSDARQAAQALELGAAEPSSGTSDSDADAGSTDSGSATGDATDGSDDSGTTDAVTSGSSASGESDGSDVDGGTDTEAASGNGVDLAAYDLVFNEEFNKDTLDATKWNTALTWGPDLVIYDQLQYYVDVQNTPDFGYNPFVLNGDELVITAIETPDDLRAAANEQPWLSGVLTSADKFDFTYGYVEGRIKTEAGLGIWPAFWMLSSEFEGLKPELYITEYDGSKPDSLFHNYNYQDSDGNLRSPGQWEVSSDTFAEGFHTVGVVWSPEELLFYIDDEPRYRIVGENVSEQDMYLIINLAMGGIWSGAPDGTTPRPATFTVDYLRVYQLKP